MTITFFGTDMCFLNLVFNKTICGSLPNASNNVRILSSGQFERSIMDPKLKYTKPCEALFINANKSYENNNADL